MCDDLCSGEGAGHCAATRVPANTSLERAVAQVQSPPLRPGTPKSGGWQDLMWQRKNEQKEHCKDEFCCKEEEINNLQFRCMEMTLKE